MARKRTPKQLAVVHCWGEKDLCAWGCIGCGECVAACKVHAIEINDRGIAHVNREECIGCGMCAKACPQHIITMAPPEATIQVLCSNKDCAAEARAVCAVSCVGCGVCERVCPADAIHVTDNLASIDTSKCIACGMCATHCPRSAIHDATGICAASF